MANAEFDSIEEMNDVQSINFYKDAIRKGKNREKYFKLASIGSRDNARTPFQWSDSKNAGFTTGKPWLKINNDYRVYNAEDEASRDDSVLSFFKKAIKLRKDTKALVYGDFTPATTNKAPVYCYFREYEGEKYYIELNLGKTPQPRPTGIYNYDLILSTNENKTDILKPFEGNIYKIK